VDSEKGIMCQSIVNNDQFFFVVYTMQTLTMYTMYGVCVCKDVCIWKYLANSFYVTRTLAKTTHANLDSVILKKRRVEGDWREEMSSEWYGRWTIIFYVSLLGNYTLSFVTIPVCATLARWLVMFNIAVFCTVVWPSVVCIGINQALSLSLSSF